MRFYLIATIVCGLLGVGMSKLELESVPSEKGLPSFRDGWRPKVLVTHWDVPLSGINILRQKCDVTICEGKPDVSRAEVLEKSRGMDAILWATHEKLNDEALDAAGSQLKAISMMSAGIDYVDIPAVKKRGIALGYTPIVLNDAVADLAVGLLIGAGRRFHEGRLKIETADFERRAQWMLGNDIKGSTVGIVGLGNIGQTIVKRLRGFDVDTFLYTGHKAKPEGDELGAKFVKLDTLLEKSDYVVIACPLTNETRNMFDKSAFAKMKSSSVLVNIARGEIVVQDDLVDALKSGTIFAAGIDVMYPEPLSPSDPLMKLPNLIITPHIGSATNRTRSNMSVIAAHNVLRGLAGMPMFAPVP